METGKYRLLSRENVHEDELIGSLLLKVSSVLDSLDAGGKPLLAVARAKDKPAALRNWLAALDVWGSYTPITPTSDTNVDSTRARSLEKLELVRTEIKHVMQEIENNTIAKEIYDLLGSIDRILLSMATAVQERLASDEERSEDTSRSSKVGHLIPLSGGHNGPYSLVEKFIYEAHLNKAGFL
jgi:hypothetical protein